MGRADDVINVAGHRLSAGAMEAAVAAHGDVAECAVIGVADALKGSMPVALIVLRAGAHPGGEAAGGAAARVRRDIGAFATLRAAVVVPRLPKTRSGKVLRATLRSIADGVAFKVPATIEEPAALEEAAAALRGVGLAKLQ
jgi:propionyl-CoA synthetase